MRLLLLSLLFFPHHPLLPPFSLLKAHWSTRHLISANDKMEFSKRGRERKSESGMKRIENSFIPVFKKKYILSLFLHNDDLRPLDFLFLSVCLCASLLRPLRDSQPLQTGSRAHAHTHTNTQTHMFIRSSCLSFQTKPQCSGTLTVFTNCY